MRPFLVLLTLAAVSLPVTATPLLAHTEGVEAPWDITANPSLLCDPALGSIGGTLAFNEAQISEVSLFATTQRGCPSLRFLPIKLAYGAGFSYDNVHSIATGYLSYAFDLSGVVIGATHRVPMSRDNQNRTGLDVALRARANNHLAGSLVLTNAIATQIGSTKEFRALSLGVTLRPYGSDRLRLQTSMQLSGSDEGALNLLSRAKLSRGLEVMIGGSISRQDVRKNVNQFALSAALRMSLSAMRTSLSGQAQSSDADGITRNYAVGVELGRFPSIAARDTYAWPITVGGDSVEALVSISRRMTAAAHDPKCAGVVLRIINIPTEASGAYAIRNQILQLKRKGKVVVAHVTFASLETLWAIAAADYVYADPAGNVDLGGVGKTTFFLKDALKKFGISAEFVRIGAYKSTPETLLKNQSSQESKRQRALYVKETYNTMIDGIASSRAIPKSKLVAMTKTRNFTMAQIADTKLVDGLSPYSELTDVAEKLTLAGHFGRDLRQNNGFWKKDKIAVVKIEGDIASGKSKTIPLIGRKSAGSYSIKESLARAAADRGTAGIIVYIDSPGGGVFASEIIARAVKAAAKRKPTVCVMANLAASGGYYSSANCQTIWATPVTLTGSIGIFAGKFNFGELLKRLGVAVEIDEQGNTTQTNMTTSYSKEEREGMQMLIQSYYEQFLKTVADGRKMTIKQVDQIAQGRIWSGKHALKVGLVDRLGDINSAIAYLAKRNQLSMEQLSIDFYPKQKPSILSSLGVPLTKELQFFSWIPVSLVVDPSVAQARLEWVPSR